MRTIAQRRPSRKRAPSRYLYGDVQSELKTREGRRRLRVATKQNADRRREERSMK
jgi:hypothetical protein